MRDQAEKLRQLVNSRPGTRSLTRQEAKARVITVTSGKGGVGKTSFTVNVALAMAGYGKKVAIIDADLGLSNIDVVLGMSTPYNMMNLLDGDVNLADIIIDGPRGIKFVSGGSGIYQLANLSEAELKMFVAKTMLFDAWADVILIDTGAGLSRNVLNFVLAADEVIIITTPEPTAITDAYAMMKAYAAYNGRAPLKLVVNRVLETDEGKLVADKLLRVAQRFLGLQVLNLGFIYEDINLIRSVKSQVPVILLHPDTVASRCIENIAHQLIYGQEIPKAKGINGFFGKFLRMLN